MQEACIFLEQKVWDKLQEVTDPEITSVSLVEMGMIDGVEVDGGKVTVKLLPTYVGCPALHMMENDVITSVSTIEEIDEVNVILVKNPIWTSDRITAEGREKLKEFGIAPPPLESKQEGVWEVECPYCSSPRVVLDNLFGPTACRSIFYCNKCKNPFEAIKPV
ncbi:1,2-phenylacetyl-CoA epoxidase subunit PaaD [Aneurinibacillus terranovensis]|uniref:1,2-phenylacetyl-CoA epoxidase subunit PaaD n=1 Tax=Aneurinibacillus terranovensis TaxID=278991 RepID=UPI000414019D|nr:1,2-phenylacetyl-CoA epoxidase subunit PaaD [Aneurinibacillus terranovensis]